MNINDFEDFLRYDYRNLKISIDNLSEKIASLNQNFANISDNEVENILSEVNKQLKKLVETHENFPDVIRNW